jgi:alkylation response protein AidB-like acyl-CoA dehydrogenase
VIDLSLQPTTGAGRRFAELAAEHASEAANGAAEHDATGTFPVALFENMKQSGFLKATVPSEQGGMGLSSVRDLGVGLGRLAQGDGSAAIAATMHLGFGLIAQRLVADAARSNRIELRQSIVAVLEVLGTGAIVMANFTEPKTDLRHPNVVATPVDGGWSITGRKTFSTLCEIADLFFVSVRTETDGGPMTKSVLVPRGTPGQQILSNWDGLGMRASGSHDVVYDGCVVPDAYMLPGGVPWGQDSDLSLRIATVGQFPLVPVFLGIAEAAHLHALDAARPRTTADDPSADMGRAGLTQLVAENERDLATCRAVVDRTGSLLDTFLMADDSPRLDIGDMSRVHALFQCSKQVVNRLSVSVVDRSMSVVGGSSYRREHPLSRLYRDVRAGGFMQPYSPVEANEYIGSVALQQ